MNIIEAAKTGLPMRRKNWPLGGWCLPDDDDFEIDYSDALADDWEVEEKEVTVTRSQFLEAWRKCHQRREEEGYDYIEASWLYKELGL